MKLSHFLCGAALLCGASIAPRAHAWVERPGPKSARKPFEISAFALGHPLTETAWLVEGVGNNRRFRLGAEPLLSLLERYVEPERDRTPEWRSFWRGRYGRQSWDFGLKLAWVGGAETPAQPTSNSDAPGFELRGPEPSAAFDVAGAEALSMWSLAATAPAPGLLAVSVQRPCPPWRAPRPVTVVRYDGAEVARLPLVDCSGAINADAVDHLSVLARPAAAPRPELPLPLEPESGGTSGEWLPQVRLLHPRLIWVVERIAEAFPGHSIFVMSGYRRDTHGFHAKGRALDLFVSGVENKQLFWVCRTLTDAGCGYYPNSSFVHVDVRPYGTHRVAWVDIALPGEPSRYVDGWPGVLEAGSAWLAGE